MYLDGLTTERLLFQKLKYSDISIWEEFFQNKDILPFLGFESTLSPHELSTQWIEKQLWRYKNNQYGHHALINKKTDEFIGQAGLLTQEVNNIKEIEIAYHIIPRFRKLHYATEAAEKVRNFAFENNICSSLISMIHEENVPSQRVAYNIGMKKEEKVHSYWRNIGRFGIFYVYRIKIESWL
jgi:RimJ/RimL family protein N-acetyltransferase